MNGETAGSMVMALIPLTGLIFLILGIIFLKKTAGMKERCTMVTTGICERPSHVRYNDQITPLFGYDVDGEHYTVAGPLFDSASEVSVSLPFNSVKEEVRTNITDKEDLPSKLKVQRKKNSIVSRGSAPLMELFPVGSTADIWYNPADPKEAYVIRWSRPAKQILGIVFTILGACFLPFGIIMFLMF